MNESANGIGPMSRGCLLFWTLANQPDTSISGKRGVRELSDLIARRGGTIVVWKLNRLARSLSQLIQPVEALTSENCPLPTRKPIDR